MGLEVLFWIWVLTWMTKTAATDVLHAVKGTANPRYELKKQRAAAAGQPVKGRPRYGTREWAADLYSDALAAHTEKRRAAAKAKAAPVDDMVDVVRERPAERKPEPTATPAKVEQMKTADEVRASIARGRADQPAPAQRGSDQPAPQATEPEVSTPLVAAALEALAMEDPQGDRRTRALLRAEDKVYKAHPGADPEAVNRAFALADRDHGCSVCGQRSGVQPPCKHQQAAERRMQDMARRLRADYVPPARQTNPTSTTGPGTRPIAPVIQMFPNPKQIEKEITMASSEVTGLSTAIAFAEAAASAHNSFASGGSEGYTGALAQHGVGEGCIGSAMEAQEASGVAAAKWAKHKADLDAQMNVKEAYQGTPDAGNREFLLNG